MPATPNPLQGYSEADNPDVDDWLYLQGATHNVRKLSPAYYAMAEATLSALLGKAPIDSPHIIGDPIFFTNIVFTVANSDNSQNYLAIDAGGVYLFRPLVERVFSITNSDSTTIPGEANIVDYQRTDLAPLVLQAISDVVPGQNLKITNSSSSPVSLTAVAGNSFFNGGLGVVSSIVLAAKESVSLAVVGSQWRVFSRYLNPLVAVATFIIESGSVISAATETTAKSILSAMVITGYTLSSKSGGSISLDIKKAAGSGSFSSIVASAPCVLSSGSYVNSTTLTGWTTSLAAFDQLKAVVNSASGLTDATLTLYGRAA